MYNCGLYTRVSTMKQVNIPEGSLETQKSRLEQFIKYKESATEEKWDVFKVYEDGGKSGKDIERPALQEMIEDIQNGCINSVICTKIDRISRSVADFSNLWKLFEKHNVQFISLAENFDSSTAIGRAMLKLTLVFAELERETTSERTRGKAEWRAEQGLWNGNVVLGYDIDPKIRGILTVNENEAELVNLIFDTYIHTKSLKETARILNDKGYRSKYNISRSGKEKKGEKFLGSTIQRILKNPVYIGKIRFKDEIYDGKHKAIISEDRWEEVQNRFKSVIKERPARSLQRKQPFYLAGILRCGYCGSFMTPTHAIGRHKKRYFYYQCTKTNHNGKGTPEQGGCNMIYVPAAEIDELIVKQIKELSVNKEFLEEVVREANLSAGFEVKRLQKEKELLLGQKKDAEDRRDNFSKIVGDGVYKNSSEDEQKVMVANFKKAMADLKEIENAILKLDFQIADENSRIFNAEIMQKSIVKFSEIFDQATEQDKGELMKLIVNKVIFTPEEIQYGLFETPKKTRILGNCISEELVSCKVVDGSP